jgi:hypothetical protein
MRNKNNHTQYKNEKNEKNGFQKRKTGLGTNERREPLNEIWQKNWREESQKPFTFIYSQPSLNSEELIIGKLSKQFTVF